MSSSEKRLESRHQSGLEASVDRGIAYIRDVFGNEGLRRIPEDVDIADGSACALAAASEMTFSEACTALQMTTLEQVRLGFVARLSDEVGFLSTTWQAKLRELRAA